MSARDPLAMYPDMTASERQEVRRARAAKAKADYATALAHAKAHPITPEERAHLRDIFTGLEATLGSSR